MFDVRSDAYIRIPYGDTIILQVNYSSEEFPFEFTARGEIRNASGEWLTQLNVKTDRTSKPGEFELISKDVIPVGLHYADIMFMTSEDYVFHSEPFMIEIVHSVTAYTFTDPRGKNGYRN